MQLKFTTIVAGVALSTVANAQFGQNGQIQFTEIAGEREFTGQMIVRPMQKADLLAQGYSESQADLLRRAAAERLHGLVLERIEPNDEYVISLPNGLDENTMAGGLMASGMYQYAEPNWMLYPLDTTPNDPQFGSQWWHQNIRSEGGWDYGTGSTNIIAAVCDTGVDSNHPDLEAHLIPGYNSVDNQAEVNGGDTEDINGHGTWCAGCVGAIGNNNRQVAGVAWDVSIMPVRVSNSSGGGAYLSDLTGGALWSGQNGATSSSVSYSGVESNSVGTTGTTLKNQYDCLMLWAAGNSNRSLNSSYDHANVIIVGATDSSNNRASFSNYGAPIDVTAPGVSILSTSRGGGTSSPSGTSFSTPITNGLCALLKATNPALSAQEVEDLIYDNARNIGSANNFGNGLIDVEASMANAGGGGGEYDLVLDLGGPLTAGTRVDWTVTGSVWTAQVYVYNGTGSGSTSTAYGDLEIANGRRVAQGRANASGTVSRSKNLPRSLSGRTVYLQVIDSTGRISEVQSETIR
ncbi:MAG: S8 family serine peptidase [Planctomycetes bacterium]|nr:S8 family serine peptidase [Planctomycetota bacterium]